MKKLFKNKYMYLFFAITMSVVIFIFCISKKNILDYILTDNSLKDYYNNNLSVHYIDVGQGDCELIKYKDITILIDSGPASAKNVVLTYLKKAKVTKIDYLIATHPHEDHIGNITSILKTFSVDKIIAPKVSNNTSVYKTMIKTIKSQDKKIIPATNGLQFSIDKELDLNFLAPNNDNYNKLNDYSAVVKLKFKDTSFLFCGDAEISSENEIINSGSDLSSTVIKIGHHGSNTASSVNFLDKVNPKIAIISCGKNNVYNHPNKETLDKLISRDILCFRTDLNKDIILISDGNTIKKLTLKNFK